jgi:beta-galactosidase
MPNKALKTTALFAALALLGGPAFAKPAATALPVASERLWMGTAWYPEQWPEAAWEKDLQLMQDQGVTVLRIGEFAWSRMEPEEGKYDLDWLVKAVHAAEKHHIKVVIGTPTDTPPAWMTQKYPDVMRIDPTGAQIGHGGRRQFSISSPRYRDFCRQIVAKMAEAVGRDPNVIGWQIGNEFTDESYDPSAIAAWHDWLKAKYRTLDKLNEVWTTAYWSQTYSSWDQVPFKTSGQQNPGLLLDAKRFITDTWVDFQKTQVDVLRKAVAPDQFITTNLGGLGWANRFDRYAINRDLDLASWDEYVGSGHMKPDRLGATHDLARGWKKKNFWVMESQPGFVNWAPVSNMLYPGETRAMSWQAVGHGADAVLNWQWRNALNGQETLHGSMIGPEGDPLPIYAEVKQVGTDFAKASPALAGTTPKAQVAILLDYDSRWAIDFQPHNANYDQIEVLLSYYRPLKAALGAVDIVPADSDLSGYKLVVAPDLNIIPEARAKHLSDYVQGGGHLLLGPRSGMKDEYNRLNLQRQPGPLADELGGRVEQFYALDVPVALEGGGTTSLWAEDLSVKAPDTRVLLKYGQANGWIDGHPAAIERTVGKGTLAYLGANADDATMTRLLGQAMTEAGVVSDFAVPDGIERMTRDGQGRHIVILVNYKQTAVDVPLPTAFQDVLNGGSVTKVSLPAQGVAVLQQTSPKTNTKGK